jgi:hypothetical protein
MLIDSGIWLDGDGNIYECCLLNLFRNVYVTFMLMLCNTSGNICRLLLAFWRGLVLLTFLSLYCIMFVVYICVFISSWQY